MRLSILRICSKVNQIDPKVKRKNFLRIYGTILFAQILLAVYIEEFALPTPDMIYDFHMKFSREFADFAMGNKYGAGVFRRIESKQESKIN